VDRDGSGMCEGEEGVCLLGLLLHSKYHISRQVSVNVKPLKMRIFSQILEFIEFIVFDKDQCYVVFFIFLVEITHQIKDSTEIISRVRMQNCCNYR